MHEETSLFFLNTFCFLESLVCIIDENHFTAIRTTARDSRRIGRANHDNFGGCAHGFRGERRSNCMIARTHSGDPCFQLFLTKAIQGRQGTTRLERPGALQELQFRVNLGISSNQCFNSCATKHRSEYRLHLKLFAQCANFLDVRAFDCHLLCKLTQRISTTCAAFKSSLGWCERTVAENPRLRKSLRAN